MKANWTTAKGSKIEIEMTHNAGICVASTIIVNGTQHKAGIETVKGVRAAKMMDNGQYIPLPAGIVAVIEADKKASHQAPTAVQMAEIAHTDRLWKLEQEMERWHGIDNVKYIQLRDAWLAEAKK